MHTTIRSIFAVASLIALTSQALAEEGYMASPPPEETLIDGLGERVMLHMGFPDDITAPGKSVPFINYVHQGLEDTLDWPTIRGMIETNDYRGIPQDYVIEACKKLRDTRNIWHKEENVDPDFLPPANYHCGEAVLIGKIKTVKFHMNG